MLKIPDRNVIELLSKTNKDELIEYLRNYDSSLKRTDSVEIIRFEYGVKISYYHPDQRKPYKNKVYLNKMDDTELLK